MTQLTKKDLEQALDKRLKVLAAKKDLEPITQTLVRTTALVAKLAEDSREFREEMKNIPNILDSHTTTLDAIYKNSEHWKTEATSLQAAIQRHEQWFAQIAEKVGVKLEGLQQ